MPHKLKGHDPLVDKKFRTLKITGRTAKLQTTTVDDSHTSMRAYKDFLNPPKIEKEPDFSKADPLFLPPDYVPPKKPGGKRTPIDPDNPKYKEKNDKIILKKRHQNLMDIGLMNFCKENSMFVTLTIDPTEYPGANLAYCHKAFLNLIRSLKNLYSGIAYIVVYERNPSQADKEDIETSDLKRSPYHIHILWNIININRYTIDKYWHRGLVDVKKNLGSVRSVLLYMGKAFDDIENFQHAFGYSKNLHLATVYRESKGEGDKIDQFFENQGKNLQQRYFSINSNTKFVNEMEFEYFHLKEPHTNYVPVAKLKRKPKKSKKKTDKET